MTREEYLEFLNGDRPKTAQIVAPFPVQYKMSNVDLVMGSLPGTRFEDKDGDIWERTLSGIRCIRNQGTYFPSAFEYIQTDSIISNITQYGPFRTIKE